LVGFEDSGLFVFFSTSIRGMYLCTTPLDLVEKGREGSVADVSGSSSSFFSSLGSEIELLFFLPWGRLLHTSIGYFSLDSSYLDFVLSYLVSTCVMCLAYVKPHAKSVLAGPGTGDFSVRFFVTSRGAGNRVWYCAVICVYPRDIFRMVARVPTLPWILFAICCLRCSRPPHHSL